MTSIDAMKLFLQKCDELGQARVAVMLDISPSAANQLYHGKYKASPDNILQRVIEVYGGLTVDCPHLGEVPLSRCAEERKKPFALVNADYTRQRKACRSCHRNHGGKP